MTPGELLTAFVNTRAISEAEPTGRDRLATTADLDRWWRERGGGPVACTEAELALARDLREGLRAHLARHNDATTVDDDRARAAFDRAARAVPIRLTDGDDVLVAADEGSSPVLTAILVAIARARIDGTWSRLKACRDPLCREAYLDTSRNRSRTWCSMEVCGARAKQRAFVDRRRAARR